MTLAEYFQSKPRGSKVAMAKKLGISKNWLSQIISWAKLPSPEISVQIEHLTDGSVKRHELRPDLFL
jgi:DNA-binding transcriptional regulator YdaS (Cro superfamily)|tara:strand:+ start:5988 stop:6188 length:201 start_codon:yes stop_codon:yes gene_type:complete